jgi:hypothetical protein
VIGASAVLDEGLWLRLVATLDSRKNKGEGRGGLGPPADRPGGLRAVRPEAPGRPLHAGEREDVQPLPVPAQDGAPQLREGGGQQGVGRPGGPGGLLRPPLARQPARGRLRRALPVGGRRDVRETEERLARLARDRYVDGTLSEDVFAATHNELTGCLEELGRVQGAIEGSSRSAPAP